MPEPPSATQSFLRLCIMLGTLVVGGMAFHLYGPPTTEINQWIDRAGRAVSELRRAGAETTVAATPDAPPAGELGPAAPPLIVDPHVRPATELVPVRRPPALLPPLDAGLAPLELHANAPPTTPEAEALMAQLRGLGAERLRLSPWGAEGALFRFECCAAMPGSAGFVRHFDAIQARPQDAIARVLQDLQQWRGGAGGRPAR